MSQLPSEESQSPSNSTWLQLEERYGAIASCQKAFARLERKRPCNTFSTKLMLPVQRLRHGDCTSDEETSDCWAQSLSSGLGLLSNWTQHLPSIEDHQITPKEIMIWDSFDVMFLCTKCAITTNTCAYSTRRQSKENTLWVYMSIPNRKIKRTYLSYVAVWFCMI